MTGTPEPALTKFHILKRVEVTPANEVDLQDATTMWEPVGWQDARDRDRDHALRLFFETTTESVDATFVAISENAWKPRAVTIKHEPKIKIEDA